MTDTPPGNAPVPSPQARAIKTYQQNHQQGSTGREAMAEAIRVIIQKLLFARDAYVGKKLDEMIEHTGKVLKILDVLREELKGSGALDDAEAGEAARYLYKTYTDAILRVSNLLSQPKPEEEFDAVIEMFKPVYKAWLPQAPGTEGAMAEPAVSAPVTQS